MITKVIALVQRPEETSKKQIGRFIFFFSRRRRRYVFCKATKVGNDYYYNGVASVAAKSKAIKFWCYANTHFFLFFSFVVSVKYSLTPSKFSHLTKSISAEFMECVCLANVFEMRKKNVCACSQS